MARRNFAVITFKIHEANELKSFIAAISAALQLVYVLALLGAITLIAKYSQVMSLYGSGDPKMMAGYLSTVIIDLGLGAIVGFLGVFLAWRVLRNKQERPSWFLPVSTFFAWAWMIFFPVGTVIGLMMRRWRRPVSADEKVNQPARIPGTD